jgi:hypothetical protein
MLGRMKEADRYFDELRSKAEKTGYVRSNMIVYVNQGEMNRVGGDLGKALRMADEGVSFAAEVGLDRSECFLTSNGAHAAFDLGEWDEAVQRIESIAPHDEVDLTEMNRLVVAVVIAAERGSGSALLEGHKRLDDVGLSALDALTRAFAWSAFISDWRWKGEFADAFALS